MGIACFKGVSSENNNEIHSFDLSIPLRQDSKSAVREFGYENEFEWNAVVKEDHLLWQHENIFPEIETFLELQWIASDDDFKESVEVTFECGKFSIVLDGSVPSNNWEGIMLMQKKFCEVQFDVVKGEGRHIGFGLATMEEFEKISKMEKGWPRWKSAYVLFDNHYCSFEKKYWDICMNPGHIYSVNINLDGDTLQWEFVHRKGTNTKISMLQSEIGAKNLYPVLLYGRGDSEIEIVVN